MLVSLESIVRPTRDILKSTKALNEREVRYMVDAYYQMQEYRKAAANQIGSIVREADEGDTHEMLDWMFAQVSTMEAQIERAMDVYSMSHVVGPWLRGIYGIGPVIGAGLLAHIDITKCPTVGHIWRNAGLDPTQRWPSSDQAEAWVKKHGLEVERAADEFGRNPSSLRLAATTNRDGEVVPLTAKTLAAAICRRPFNAKLKTLCWKIGQSFMKFSGRTECYYGMVYRERKAYEISRNEAGGNGAAAANVLESRPTHAQRAIYSTGMLPPAQIDARARRYAVKLFLAHLHEVWYEAETGEKPPKPYAVAHLGHAHIVPPPTV